MRQHWTRGMIHVSVTQTLTCGAHTQTFPKAFRNLRAKVPRFSCLQQWFRTTANHLRDPMLHGWTWCTIRFHFIRHLVHVKQEPRDQSPRWRCNRNLGRFDHLHPCHTPTDPWGQTPVKLGVIWKRCVQCPQINRWLVSLSARYSNCSRCLCVRRTPIHDIRRTLRYER